MTRPSRLVVGVQLLLVVLGLVALGFFAFAELLLAWPVEWWLYALLVSCFSLGLVRPVPLARQRGRSIALLVAWLVIAALYLVPWTSRKPFLRRLYSIQLGMDETEVRRIMAGYIEGTGFPARVPGAQRDVQQVIDASSGNAFATEGTPSGEMGIKHSLVYRHSTESHFNADWGIVRFEGGRVAQVSFSPD